MTPDLTPWRSILVCPLDRTPLDPAPLANEGVSLVCPACGFRPALADVGGRTVLDFRAVNVPQQVTVTFTLPVQPLDRYELVKTHFRAPGEQFAHHSRREIRRRFGTKLDKGIQFYCQKLFHDFGPDAPILDLGCGSGGNRRYLHSLGFKNVLTVDWAAAGADLLVDAHRLPLADGAFRMVISTAVFEHLYNPFVAMAEIGRVLDGEGRFLGGASFWEGWHASSHFHLTPDGWNAVLGHAGFKLDDLWPGWGIIPAALAHVLTPGRLRGLGYALQGVVEGVYRLFLGEPGARRLHLRASGAYQVYATRRERV